MPHIQDIKRQYQQFKLLAEMDFFVVDECIIVAIGISFDKNKRKNSHRMVCQNRHFNNNIGDFHKIGRVEV